MANAISTTPAFQPLGRVGYSYRKKTVVLYHVHQHQRQLLRYSNDEMPLFHGHRLIFRNRTARNSVRVCVSV